MKLNLKTWVLTCIVCFLPVLAGIILYPHLPEQIATHWDINGNPNGYSTKAMGAVAFPCILLLVDMLFPFLLSLDPKNKNMSPKLISVVLWILPAVSILCSSMTLCAAFDIAFRIEVIMPLFLGFLFILIGNYLPKTKQSYSLGIRIPWTLESEDNWNKTHRFAGFIWFFGGILMLIFSFFSWRGIAIFSLLGTMILLPIIYSGILLYRDKK